MGWSTWNKTITGKHGKRASKTYSSSKSQHKTSSTMYFNEMLPRSVFSKM